MLSDQPYPSYLLMKVMRVLPIIYYIILKRYLIISVAGVEVGDVVDGDSAGSGSVVGLKQAGVGEGDWDGYGFAAVKVGDVVDGD